MVRYHQNQNSTKSSKSCWGGKPSLVLEGATILCLHCADLLMTFWLWKFQKKWMNIKHAMASCAMWQSRAGKEMFLPCYVLKQKSDVMTMKQSKLIIKLESNSAAFLSCHSSIMNYNCVIIHQQQFLLKLLVLLCFHPQSKF